MLSLLKNSCEDQKSYQDVVEFIGPAAEELDNKIVNWLKLKSNTRLYFKAMGQVEKMKRMERKTGTNIDWNDIDSIATKRVKNLSVIQKRLVKQAVSQVSINWYLYLMVARLS